MATQFTDAELEIIAKEILGTLTAGEDPSGAGSQATEYGYLQGGGLALSEKQDELNAVRDGTTGATNRSISISIRPDSGPGKVQGTVFTQSLKQAVDSQEDADMENGVIGTIDDLAKWRTAKELYFFGETESSFLVTDELQSQLLDAIPNNIMPNTRANLIDSLNRFGRRAEELFGVALTTDDMLAAEEWSLANGGNTLRG